MDTAAKVTRGMPKPPSVQARGALIMSGLIFGGRPVSQDGTHACGAFPWQHIGIATLAYKSDGAPDPERSERKDYIFGCFPGISPDNEYRMFALQGNHKQIAMFDAGGRNRRLIDVSSMPGVNGQAICETRWSYDPLFFVCMGPEHGKTKSIYMGKFDEKFTRMEAWAQLGFSPMSYMRARGLACPDSEYGLWPHAWIAAADAAGEKPTDGFQAKTLKAQ
jgi:hypothetical protein